VLKDNKFLIYGGGLLAVAAVIVPAIPSEAVVCIDNRFMCAPLAPATDEPSGNEPQPLTRINSLSVIASTGTLVQPSGVVITSTPLG
jgi:hypothetical protein